MANFFKCDTDCGSVFLEMTPSKNNCIANGLAPLTANSVDAAVEKHVPVASLENGKVVVRVGSQPHPMLPEHYIEWIYVKTSFGGMYCMLNPGDPPEAALPLQADEVEEVYAYCNIHGLWKAQEPVLPTAFASNDVACSPEFASGCVDPSAT